MNYNPEDYNNNSQPEAPVNEAPVEDLSQFSYDVEAPVVEENKPNKVFGIISMILGILSVLMGCCYGSGFLFAVAAVILAIVDKKKNGKFTGMALAGLICGCVGLAIALIWVLYFIIVFGAAILGNM